MAAYIPVIIGAPADRPDDADTARNAETVRAALESLGARSEIVTVDLDLTVLETLAGVAPDVVFNLVESIRGDGRLGFCVCAALDHLGVAYTGAPTAAYVQSSSKLLTKSLLKASGLATSDCWTGSAPRGRRVIVKSVWEHASYGIDQGSVVDGADAADEIARRQERFGGLFFAEAYIAGREFNVSVLERDHEPVVLPMAEMRFDALPPGILPIVDYTAKWSEDSASYRLLQRRFGVESLEPDLAGKLEAAALDCWRAAGLRGYARIDVRVDEAGEVYILEFNANPCLAPDAGFAAAVDAAGLSYVQAIDDIVAAAHPHQATPCSAFAL